MRITLSDRVAAAVAVAVIAAGVQALLPLTGPGAHPAATAAPARPSGAVVAQDAPGAAAQAAAVRYWTPARMAATLQAAGQASPGGQSADQAGQQATAGSRRLSRDRPLVKKSSPVAARGPGLTGETAGAGLRWTQGGAVAGAVGKIFFTLGSADYVCSGSLVGGHPGVALTAAHCVGGGPRPGGARQWAANWVFVPGYRDGTMPYGEYTARRFLAAPEWAGPQGGTEQYDVAFVQLTEAALDGGSGAAAGAAGLPLQFANSQDAALPGHGYVFGYPAESPYSGLYLNYCAGPVSLAAGSAATGCAMTAGDSGGPWLAGFSPGTGNGRLFAVSTYKLSTSARVLYGAVLGPEARALYTRAVSPAR